LRGERRREVEMGERKGKGSDRIEENLPHIWLKLQFLLQHLKEELISDKRKSHHLN